jgi:hypothetical protein
MDPPVPSSGSRRYRFGTFDEPESSGSSASNTMNVETNAQVDSRPGATPAASSSKDKAAYRPGNKRATVWSWFTSQDLYLNNVGSVARDHLAVIWLHFPVSKEA